MAKSNESTLVLVADDEPSTLALVASHVRSKGFKVLEASDGDQAWQLAHEHLPDLVILDVMMPGMSGWEVCRKIREAVSLAHTGIVMLTGIGENLNEMTSPLYGADTYIDKPFEFSDLDNRIEETLHRRNQGLIGRAEPEPEPAAESSARPASGATRSSALDEPPAKKTRATKARRTAARTASQAKKATKKARRKATKKVTKAKSTAKKTKKKVGKGAARAKRAAKKATAKAKRAAKRVTGKTKRAAKRATGKTKRAAKRATGKTKRAAKKVPAKAKRSARKVATKAKRAAKKATAKAERSAKRAGGKAKRAGKKAGAKAQRATKKAKAKGKSARRR